MLFPVLRRRQLLGLAAASSLLSACGKKRPQKTAALPAGTTVLALGDSLTQGVGASGASQAWPALLAQASNWNVINAGISGDTSAQALQRLPALLDEHRPALVLIGIGGNDFLRQMSAAAARDNIRRMVQLATDGGAQVLLIGIPQFSLLAASTGRLSDHPLYAELAKELDLPLHGGGWSEVLSRAELRADQIHANDQGYALFAQGLQDSLQRQGWLQ